MAGGDPERTSWEDEVYIGSVEKRPSNDAAHSVLFIPVSAGLCPVFISWFLQFPDNCPD